MMNERRPPRTFTEEDMLSFGTFMGSAIIINLYDLITSPTPREFLDEWLRKGPHACHQR